MTLIELMVALAILGLCAGLVFSNLGPWLSQSRSAQNDALFWRALAPAQLALSELTTAAVNPSARAINTSEARFQVYLPRLAPEPVSVDLKIEPSPRGARLLLRSPTLAQASVLLDQAPPLRFATRSDGLVLEAQAHQAWQSVAIASFSANAPLTCSFDPISRSCR